MISIVVPVYNAEKSILRLVNDITNQDFDLHKVQLILIDDASKDGTIKTLKQIRDLFKKLRIDLFLMIRIWVTESLRILE